MKEAYSIETLCALLEVSKSGYYGWQRRRTTPGPRAKVNDALAKTIAEIHARSRQTYGSPRIVRELRKQDQHHGRNRVSRLMNQSGLCGRQKGRYRVQTTDSNHDQPIAPNRLAEAPAPTGPNQIWTTDITYIDTGEGWLYLAGVLDLYSRKLVGWAMSERIDTPLVLDALNMALLHRAAQGFAVPFRSRRPIRQRRLPGRPRQGRLHRLHEPQSQLLRQRHHGKLLEHPQNRIHLPTGVRHPQPGPRRDLRLHRNLLQSPALPHRAVLPFSR